MPVITPTITAPSNSLVIKPTTDATDAIKIADKDGNAIVTVDTVNNTLTGVTMVAPALGTPTSGTLTNCTTATASDNDADTSLASTAFAKGQDAVLAREPNQGVAMTYAASGPSGIAVAASGLSI